MIGRQAPRNEIIRLSYDLDSLLGSKAVGIDPCALANELYIQANAIHLFNSLGEVRRIELIYMRSPAGKSVKLCRDLRRGVV